MQLGIGLSVYVEVTNPIAGPEFGAIEINADGSATVRTGSSPHGQGHVTAWAMVASEKTGIPMDKIEVVHGDTDRVPYGPGTMGSRSAQRDGMAVAQAADQVVEKAKAVAADLLEAAAGDVVLDTATGRFHVAGSASPHKEWAELVSASPEALAVETAHEDPGPSFPFGAHVCVVEVDKETGEAEIKRFVAVDDCGRQLNPMIVQGQIHGGIAQGIAQALYEEAVYNKDGTLVTGSMADYAIPTANEMPAYDLDSTETPR